MKELQKSQYGEGTGGTSSVTDDPDKPSFDPALHVTGTDKKIEYLLCPHTISLLSDWERDFLLDVYGKSPLSRKAHIKVSTIFRKHTRPKPC